MIDTPYWIAIGDLHRDTTNLQAIPEYEDATGVLVTGDITFAGGIKDAEETLQPLIKSGKRLLVQPGNMDAFEVLGWLKEKGWNIHCQWQPVFDDVPCLGLGFSTITPFKTPSEFPDEHFADWLKKAMESAPFSDSLAAGSWIFSSHNPPHDTQCDRLENGVHVGSMAVREFIERHQPTLCLCGHIHESAGICKIGNTLVLNPGALSDGGYILITQTTNPLGAGLEATLKHI